MEHTSERPCTSGQAPWVAWINGGASLLSSSAWLDLNRILDDICRLNTLVWHAGIDLHALLYLSHPLHNTLICVRIIISNLVARCLLRKSEVAARCTRFSARELVCSVTVWLLGAWRELMFVCTVYPFNYYMQSYRALRHLPP